MNHLNLNAPSFSGVGRVVGFPMVVQVSKIDYIIVVINSISQDMTPTTMSTYSTKKIVEALHCPKYII